MSLAGRIKLFLRESWVVGELYVLYQRMTQGSSDRRLLVMPYAMYTGTAGDLRGVAVGRALRKRGWRTIIVPPWLGLRSRRRIIRREKPGAILLQQSVHPLNRPRFYEGVPCVFDADDAYILNDRVEVEECFRDSAALVAGSRYMARRMKEFNGDVSIIWTGTYISQAEHMPPNAKRRPIVAWATSDMFSALQEAEFVREILLKLSRRQKFIFWLYGSTDNARAEEFVKPLREAGVEVKVFRLMRYRDFIASLSEVAVGLTPVCRSHTFFQGKSFGKVLAYMAADVAVVASNAIDHPLFFRHGENGMLADENADEWVDCCAALLADPQKRGQIVARGRIDFLTRMSITRCAELLEPVLMRAINRSATKERAHVSSH